MAAVELADRKEIERGDKEPEPGSKADRMEHDISLRRYRPDHHPRHELQQQRLAQLQSIRGRSIHDRGETEADDQRDDGDRKSRQGTGNPDVEQGAPTQNRTSHADDGAECPDEMRWSGNEQRQGSRHPVDLGQEVMPQLMRREDKEQRSRERDSTPKRLRRGKEKIQRAACRTGVGLVRPCPQRGKDGQEKEDER